MHLGQLVMRVRRWRRTAPSLVLLLTSAGIASPDRPTVWGFAQPAGAAANHSAFRQLLIMYPRSGETGTSLAQRLADEIRSRKLTSDRVGVLIFGYGRFTPPLAYDAGDAVTLDSSIAGLANGTPWLASGLPKARAWTDAFIAEYRRLQLRTGLPSPARFHMDCELRLPKLCYQWPDASGLHDCWDTPPLQVFDALVADARWSTERIPFAVSGGVTWRTLREIHELGGAPAWNSALPRSAEVNRVWSRWFDAMQRSVMEGALDQALYGPVREAWPDCRSSEFAQSLRVDGALQADGTRRTYRDFEWWLNGWMDSAWCGAADLQTPAMYVCGTSFTSSDADWIDANLRIDRANLDACLHSFGGADPSTVTPWVMLPGAKLPIDETREREIDADVLDERVAMMRWRGLSEFQVWPGASAQDWTRLARGVDAVWSAEIFGASLVHGMCDAPDLDARITRADRCVANVTSDAGLIDLRVTVRGEAGAAGPCARDRVLVHVEGFGQPGTLFVDAAEHGDPELGWIQIGASSVGSTASTGFHRWWLAGAERCVAPDGSIMLRLRVVGGAFTLDLLQAVRFPDAGVDLDGSGWVDTGDLAMALVDFGETAGTAADLDGSGMVDTADIALLLLDFGPCGS